MKVNTLRKYLTKFKEKNVIIIGDVMLDKYIIGNVERISPEAPVPIIEVVQEKYVPGGAANAASNVATMQGNSFLLGVVGNDSAKDILIKSSQERGINTDGIIIDVKRPTIQKIRVIGHTQQLVRIDYENKQYIEENSHNQLINIIKKIKKVDMIIVSDYAKGTITESIMKEIKEFAKPRKIPIIVDPKPKHKSFYKNVTIITPNKKEAEELSGMHIETQEDIETVGKKLMTELDCNVLITLGERGMALFEKEKKSIYIPTVAQEVFDVSGAGDTVIATLGLAISAGATLEEAAILANHAAGIKVGKLGTAPVYLEELDKNLNKDE